MQSHSFLRLQQFRAPQFLKKNRNSTFRWRRFLSSSALTEENYSNECDLKLVKSPYPPIFPPASATLSEFVSEDWNEKSRNDKTAILDGTTGLSRTFHDYSKYSSSIAASLHFNFDVDETSTVVLFSPNHVDYVPITVAVSLCGAKLSPVNPLYKPRELHTVLNQCRADVMIVHSSMIDTALEAARECPALKHILVIPDPTREGGEICPEGTTNLEDLINYDGVLNKTVNSLHKDPSKHPVLLPFSSGTTGLPKAVCLSHQNIIANLMQFDEVETFGFPSDHKVISPLPFFHIYGFLCSALYTAWRGQQTITMSGKFNLEDFCKLVQEHQPQRAHLVPPIILNLAKSPIVDQYDFSSLQMILSAAAPLSTDIEEAVLHRIHAQVKQLWGMSELSPFGTISSDYSFKSGSSGPLAPSTYGKILNSETGEPMGPNQTGELMIKGPQVMMGYLDNPKATAECLDEKGWLKTGDLAHYDEEGYFYITDRLKELIKVSGYQVAPAELEALLLTNEHVQDVAVIGIPDEVSGEAVRAYVVLKKNELSANVSEREIQAWVEDRVAPYKKLKGGVMFRDEVPKSASGKILRRLLRDELKEVSA